MNKTLLQKLIREEIKNLKEQSIDQIQGKGFANVPNLDKQKELGIQRFANRLGVKIKMSRELTPDGVTVQYISFLSNEEVEESVFEKFIKLLQEFGFDVDMGMSIREPHIETDDNKIEKITNPRIYFK